MTTASRHRLDSNFDPIGEFISNTPADTLVRIVTIPIYLRQIHRLQTRTSSWLDKPTPLAFQALMLALSLLVRQALTSKIELRQPSLKELGDSLWIGELSTPILVKVSTSDSAAQFIVRDGKRTLAVPQRFFTKSEAGQRRRVAAAEHNDATHLPATLATRVLDLSVERAIWHLVVGDRPALSKRRAAAFVGVELARTQVIRIIRPALVRRIRKA